MAYGKMKSTGRRKPTMQEAQKPKRKAKVKARPKRKAMAQGRSKQGY